MQPISAKDIQVSTPPLLSVSTGRKWVRRLVPSLWFLVGWAILALGWELGAATQVLNPDILPPPSQVIPYLLKGELSAGIGPQQVSYGEAIVRTLVGVTTGLVLGILTALPLGTLIASVPIFRQFAMPIVQTIAPITPVAWVPVAIALVGTGINPQFLSCSWVSSRS